MALGKAKSPTTAHGIAAAILWGVVCLFWAHASAQETGQASQSASLEKESVLSNTVASNTDAIGKDIRGLLVPRRQVKISGLIAARVKSIHVKTGDRFSEGQSLITFECDALTASLRSTRARLKQYELVHKANIELRKDNAVSKLDFALSGAKVEEGKAEVSFARAQLRKCEVSAPYAGRVVEVIVSEHENVSVGDDLIAILDDKHLEMTLHVPSKWVTSVSAGKKFKIGIDETGKTYDAVVLRTSPKIDPTSRTFEITAQIRGEHPELLAGMSGDAFFGPLR